MLASLGCHLLSQLYATNSLHSLEAQRVYTNSRHHILYKLPTEHTHCQTKFKDPHMHKHTQIFSQDLNPCP